VTDREMKRFERFLKSAEKAETLDITVRGTVNGEPYAYRFVKDRYTNYKIKLLVVRDQYEYCDPEPYLEIVRKYSRHVKSIRGAQEWPRGKEKDVGGKIYHYDKYYFVKYFQRT